MLTLAWHYQPLSVIYNCWFYYLLFLVADTCGEHLAWFFGITTPKYQYAIDEYYRMKEEVSKLHINTYFVENSRKKVYSWNWWWFYVVEAYATFLCLYQARTRKVHFCVCTKAGLEMYIFVSVPSQDLKCTFLCLLLLLLLPLNGHHQQVDCSAMWSTHVVQKLLF